MRKLLISFIFVVVACDGGSETVTRSADGCVLSGTKVTLDANAYGFNIEGVEQCDRVTVQADTIVLDVLDGSSFRVGVAILQPDATGHIVIDTRIHDGASAEPAEYPTIPCDPEIQCCVPKEKIIDIKTKPRGGDPLD